MKIRVLTYNILGFSPDEAPELHYRKKSIVKSIEQNNFDVVFLQEVKTLWSQERKLTHCSEAFFRQSKIYQNGCFFVYADQRAQSQNAEGLMTRLPVTRFDFGTLPMGLFGRSFLLVSIKLNGIPIHLLTSHLEPPAIGRMITQYGATTENQDKIRIKQLLKIEEIIQSLPPNDALIVGGDFNMELTVPEFEHWVYRQNLTPVFPDTKENPRKTFATHASPSFNCGLDSRLDHLFFRQGRDEQINLNSEGFIFDEPLENKENFFYGYLSDHRGIWAEFEIK